MVFRIFQLLIFWFLVVLVNLRALAQSPHSGLPDPSSRSVPILEFRARPVDIDFKELKKSSPGHGMIFLGRIYEGGLTIFEGAVGFYPDRSDEGKVVSSLIAGPGKVDYYLEDLDATTSFRIYLTPEQERRVRFIIKHWKKNKQYKFVVQNCVHFMRDVAEAVGLETSPATLRHPTSLVNELILRNKATTAVEKFGKYWRQQQSNLQDNVNKFNDDINKKIERAKRKSDSARERQFLNHVKSRTSQQSIKSTVFPSMPGSSAVENYDTQSMNKLFMLVSDLPSI